MLFVLDEGNSQVAAALLKADRTPQRQWRLTTRPDRTADDWCLMLRQMLQEAEIAPENLEGSAICSVVQQDPPPLQSALEELLGKPCHVLSVRSPLGFSLAYQPPETLGADRLANVLGAMERSVPPFLVLDAGTAITLDALDANAIYQGGVILPGPKLFGRALAAHTARLPEVDLKRPLSPLGRSTREGLQGGVCWGLAGALERLVEEGRAELDAPECPVFLTGGWAGFLADLLRFPFQLCPALTLEGLALAWEKARGL